jgi:hypothetical protein
MVTSHTKGISIMVYELRTYWAAAGKLEDLHNRFRHLTLGIFKRHQMDVVAFWTPADPTPETGSLVYIMRFADEAAMKAAWEAFRADPDWIAGRTASEVNGKLVDKVTSVVLNPTDYSVLQ